MKFLAVLGVLFSFSALSEAQTYTPIEYNGTHPTGDIQSCRPGNNPLGYYCTTQYNYENTGNTPTSYFFNNVDGRKMEILVEPLDLASTVAFRVANFPKVIGNGGARYCEDAVNGTVTFECDDGDGCPNTDISIWYRITLSPSDPDPENWCNERGDLANLPSSLLVVPEPFTKIECNSTHPVEYPNCSFKYCKRKRKALCTKTDADGDCTCKVTSCAAAYYSVSERPPPGWCSRRNKCAGLTGEKLKQCLRKWAKCVKKAFKAQHGKTPANLRKKGSFKCLEYPCAGS